MARKFLKCLQIVSTSLSFLFSLTSSHLLRFAFLRHRTNRTVITSPILLQVTMEFPEAYQAAGIPRHHRHHPSGHHHTHAPFPFKNALLLSVVILFLLSFFPSPSSIFSESEQKVEGKLHACQQQLYTCKTKLATSSEWSEEQEKQRGLAICDAILRAFEMYAARENREREGDRTEKLKLCEANLAMARHILHLGRFED